MDKRMLRFYDKELAHLRAMGGEFAKEFPKIAGRKPPERLRTIYER